MLPQLEFETPTLSIRQVIYSAMLSTKHDRLRVLSLLKRFPRYKASELLQASGILNNSMQE